LTNGLLEIEKALPKADIFRQDQLFRLEIAIKQLLPLSRKYHCIVDNPPYMGGGNMNKPLSDFVKTYYPDSKADLMACFMEAGWNMLLPKGIIGMINLPSWLFLSSFEKLREKLINEKHVDSLLHMGRGIFGVDWGSTAFIIQNQYIKKDSKFFKLHKRNFQHLYPEDIQKIFLKSLKEPLTKIDFDKYRDGDGVANVNELVDENGQLILYTAHQKEFKKIPGSPIGYWLSDQIRKIFESSKVLDLGRALNGLFTCDNERFLRFSYEISSNSINSKWFNYNKGGGNRKWYGLTDYVVNFENNGAEIINKRKAKGQSTSLPGRELYFENCVTWSALSAGDFSARLSDNNAIFDIAGSSFKGNTVKADLAFLGFVNSKVCKLIFEAINPTLNYQVGNIRTLPLQIISECEDLVKSNIEISKNEWFSRETSMGFKKNYFSGSSIENISECYDLYQQFWFVKFEQLKKNEEQLNHIIINNYELQDEIKPDVAIEDITILKEETSIDNGKLVFHADVVFAQFVSYAVGCMFGRYSLDKEGLILANQGEGFNDFLSKIGASQGDLSFIPDEDNIIPILDDEWFEDDIVARFYAFLKASFGEKEFQKNLAFVEECLGKDIRKYFVKDFYNDHIKRYKKRPIYWMFSSPKGSFNVLIYLHRYTPDTLNKILNSYLREFIEKLTLQRKQLEHIEVNGTPSEQSKARKEIDKIDIKLADCKQYEAEILYPLASERIALDLDDGVLVNYNKLGAAVALVPGLNDGKTKKKVKEFDWIDTTQIR
jgi:hypothetical protein